MAPKSGKRKAETSSKSKKVKTGTEECPEESVAPDQETALSQPAPLPPSQAEESVAPDQETALSQPAPLPPPQALSSDATAPDVAPRGNGEADLPMWMRQSDVAGRGLPEGEAREVTGPYVLKDNKDPTIEKGPQGMAMP